MSEQAGRHVIDNPLGEASLTSGSAPGFDY